MDQLRRYDIDWLRVFATYMLLPFHVAMVFNPAPFYHIRNSDVSFFFLILCGFIGLWHMPLFFLLAGWSAFSSLSIRGTGGFLRERFFRLFVPLVAGCVLLMPSIKYLELSNGLDANYTGLYVEARMQTAFQEVIPSGLPTMTPFDESFLDFLPTFFTELTRFTWAHLWFMAYLLTFTVIYLPLLRWLVPLDGRLVSYSRSFRIPKPAFRNPLWVYVPILPLAIIQVTMRERWPGLQNLIDDWANFAFYSTYLICGFLLARFPAFEAAAHRERKRALVIGLAATLVLLLGALGVFSSAALMLAHTAIAGWCFVVAFLGWARERLSFATPALPYLTESALPVYILHQSAIVLPGYFLIQLPLDLWAKFILLLVVATAVTMSVYHLLVRPFSIPRFLCGMKPRQRRAQSRLARRLSAAAAITLVTMAALDTASSTIAAHDSGASPLGRWYAEGGAAQVEITDCGGELCGRVVWLRSPFDEDGCELRDRHNPDESLRRRPVIGLEILRALERVPAATPTWKGGTIYDPASGQTYRASLRLSGSNRLELRGYIGIPLIGRTTTWFRVGAEGESCREAS
jgi:uncharacterized protein (DUF2147 family)